VEIFDPLLPKIPQEELDIYFSERIVPCDPAVYERMMQNIMARLGEAPED
jgi:hypothetical protein